MYIINYKSVTEHKRMCIQEMFGKLEYYDLKRHFEYSNPAGVKNPFVLFGSDISAFSLAHNRTLCSFV